MGHVPNASDNELKNQVDDVKMGVHVQTVKICCDSSHAPGSKEILLLVSL